MGDAESHLEVLLTPHQSATFSSCQSKSYAELQAAECISIKPFKFQ